MNEFGTVTESNLYRVFKYLTSLAMLAYGVQLLVWWLGIGPDYLFLLFMLLGNALLSWILGPWQIGYLPLPFPKYLVEKVLSLSLWTTAGILVVFFGIPWLLKYRLLFLTFDLSQYDAGLYSNVVFNSSQGNWMFSSFLDRNHLGIHFSPVVLLFVPLYWIYPSLEWLLFAQILSYLAVPFVMVHLVRTVIQNRRNQTLCILGLTLLWFLYRPILAAMNFPFHPSTLAAPWVLYAFLCLERRAWLKMWVVLLFLLTFKETLTLAWIGFGLYLLFVKRDQKRGLLLVLSGTLLFFAFSFWIIPFFRESSWGHLSRIGLTTDPFRKLVYLLRLLTPVGFLPLIYPRFGLIALPALSLNLIARFRQQYSMDHHYDDLIAPLLLLICLLVAEDWFEKGIKRFSLRERVIYLVIVWNSVMIFPVQSPLRYVRLNPHESYHETLSQELKLIEETPEEVMIYIQDRLGTHLRRFHQRPLPRNLESCESFEYQPGSLIVFSRYVDPWPDRRMESCLESIQTSDRFEVVQGYEYMEVFRVK